MDNICQSITSACNKEMWQKNRGKSKGKERGGHKKKNGGTSILSNSVVT